MIVFASFTALVSVAPQAASGPLAAAHWQQPEDAREIVLTLPHPLRKDETTWLLVEVGAIDHNQIQLTTQEGRSLGTISPFAVRAGRPVGTYTIPLPSDAFHDGRIALRLTITQGDGEPRAPTTEEVKSLRLLLRPITKGR